MAESRRDVLATGTGVVLAALAGCSSVTGGSTSTATEPPTPTVVFERQAELIDNQFTSWGIRVEDTMRVSWEMTVERGPPLDLLLMAESQFQPYKNEREYETVASGAGTTHEGSATLSDGSYRFVVDFTDAGEVTPKPNYAEDEAVVSLRVESQTG